MKTVALTGASRGIGLAIAEQFLGAGKPGKQQGSALVVAHLAFGQQQHDRSAKAIADGMEL